MPLYMKIIPKLPEWSPEDPESACCLGFMFHMFHCVNVILPLGCHMLTTHLRSQVNTYNLECVKSICLLSVWAADPLTHFVPYQPMGWPCNAASAAELTPPACLYLHTVHTKYMYLACHTSKPLQWVSTQAVSPQSMQPWIIAYTIKKNAWLVWLRAVGTLPSVDAVIHWDISLIDHSRPDMSSKAWKITSMFWLFMCGVVGCGCFGLYYSRDVFGKYFPPRWL